MKFFLTRRFIPRAPRYARGRNHAKKDTEFSRVYKFRAMDEEVKASWVKKITDVMEGKYTTLEDMQSRWNAGLQGGGGGEEGEVEKLFKTNLARLLNRGDDWDEVGLMSEEEVRYASLAKRVSMRLLYTSLRIRA